MARTKSTETKQILKDNTKQTRYSKTKPDSKKGEVVSNGEK
jgi:hypothetical protein